MKRFNKFCVRFNVFHPFPVSESTLCAYAAYLADDTLSPQTIKSYLSALRSMQISLGLPDPRDQNSLPVLKRVQAGIRRAHMLKGSQPRVRLPITISIIRQLRTAWDRASDPNKVVLWAVACTAFFVFFRLGELLLRSKAEFHPATSLAWGDVAVDSVSNPSMVRIHLKKSKCDQFGGGVDIVLGVSRSNICPVAALLSYLADRGDKPGPLFLDNRGQPLLYERFVTKVRKVLELKGIPHHQYAGHSFRIGAATAAAKAGIQDSTIQALGRWHSAAFLQYIRIPRDELAGITTLIANSDQQALSSRASHRRAQ